MVHLKYRLVILTYLLSIPALKVFSVECLFLVGHLCVLSKIKRGRSTKDWSTL